MRLHSKTLCAIASLTAYLIVSPVYSADKTIQTLKKEFLTGYKCTQTGQYAQGARQFSKIKALNVGMRDYILFYLGKSLLEGQRCDEARDVFRELMEQYPESRWVGVVDGQLRATEPCAPLEVAAVPEPKADCESIEGMEAKVDCYFSSRQYRRAKELYLDLCKTPSVTCLTRLSQAAARSQDFATAIEANRTLMAQYPRSKVSEVALKKIAFLYQDSGDYRQAIPLLEGLESKTRNPQEKRHYRERLGWSRFRLEDYKGAIRSFDEALSAGETPFSLYWKGRSLERLGRQEEAEEIFRGLIQIYRENYYGIRAVERLLSPLHRGKVEDVDANRPWASISHGIDWGVTVESLEKSPDLERIHELAELGLVEDATIEARRLRIRSGARLPSDPRKIVMNASEQQYQFQVRVPKKEDSEYRLPFADFLFSSVAAAKIQGLDPFLLFAMMRQESHFRESVVSPAGAIGLLQIMPWTGQRLAREDGWPEFQTRWLYDPVTNIELAVQYVKKLWNLLDGKWYGVAASYNAGEKVVAEWQKQRRGLPEEEFIEEIPYGETRDYVRKVYTNWKAYRLTYGAE